MGGQYNLGSKQRKKKGGLRQAGRGKEEAQGGEGMDRKESGGRTERHGGSKEISRENIEREG